MSNNIAANALVNELRAQREGALDKAANLAAQLAVQKEIAVELKKEIERLNAPKKPKQRGGKSRTGTPSVQTDTQASGKA